MSSPYLTKSDFRVAQTCPTKLYYRQLGYPTINDDSDFMLSLSEQGYLVEALTRLGYPTGRRVDTGTTVEQQARVAAETLQSINEITLFEATVISKGKLARVDILEKKGNTLRLIEIKSTAYDEPDGNGHANDAFWTRKGTPKINSKWRSHLEDVTYQWLVLREAFPDAIVEPYLVLLDTTQRTAVDHADRLLEQANGEGPRPEIATRNLVIELDVSQEVAALLPDVEAATALFLTAMGPQPKRLGPKLSTACRDCEYRVDASERSGFNECWGELADVSPHILDLFSVSTIGGTNSGLVDDLIVSGQVSLYDIPTESLVKRDGTVGVTAERQLRQIHQTRLNEEWVDPALGRHLQSAAYPLHFIDFETCTPTIPRYSGMRPFELIAFQWSCHTIESPGASARHSEWIQANDRFPNADFVAKLRSQLGNAGTILIWSGHELTVLRAIRNQISDLGHRDADLCAWLDTVLAVNSNSRVLDMHKLAARHYYHPLMGGKTSIKAVCEAVWAESEALRSRYPEFVTGAETIQSPYRSLPPLRINGEETRVRNGTDAILAYRQMMGDHGEVTSEGQLQWRQLLSQYCHLDTLAMVMIWEHWQQATESVSD